MSCKILYNLKLFDMQMSAAKAREACQHWWMKEALDILVERLTSAQKQEEENALACSLSWLIIKKFPMILYIETADQKQFPYTARRLDCI